jgi:hypothetical protein
MSENASAPEPRNQCSFCPKSFQSPNDLERHYKQIHKMTGKVIVLDDNPISIAGWMEHTIDDMRVCKQCGWNALYLCNQGCCVTCCGVFHFANFKEKRAE